MENILNKGRLKNMEKNLSELYNIFTKKYGEFIFHTTIGGRQLKYKMIQRKSLRRALGNIERYPYTVVTAPMGYGKSTAVREYLDDNNKNYVWISVGTKQVIAAYIWERVTRQIQGYSKEFGTWLNNMGFPEDEKQLMNCIKAIGDELNNSNFVLVIDDYHLINNKEIDNFLLNLVMEDIPNFHVVVISRGEPNTNIHELMLKGYCNKIEQEIFEFSKEEIREFFNINDCDISEDKVDEIYGYTEGWIAAIYLVMMEIMRTGGFGKDYTLDRLVESAVFSQYDEESQELLLKLSILDSYTMEQAIYITKNKKVALLLWDLCNYNSFLKYDSASGVYKPHNILNNFLNNKMHRSSHINESELLCRAGEWYIENGDVLLGFSYIILTNNYNRILEELSKPGSIDLVAKYPDVIKGIFNRVSKEDRLTYPIAYITYLYWVIVVKNDRQVRGELEEIENYCNNNYDVESEEYKEIIGEVYLAKAMIANSAEEFISLVNIAKKNINKNSKIIYEQSGFSFIQPLLSLTFHNQLGKYRKYTEAMAEETKCYLRMIGGNNGCLESLIKSEYYLETMNIKSALICAKEAIYESELNNKEDMVIAANFALLRIQKYNNYTDEFEEIFEKMDNLIKENNNLKKQHVVDMCKVYIYSRMKCIDKIPEEFMSLQVFNNIENYKLNLLKYIVQCDLLVLQEKYIELSVISNNLKKYVSGENLQLGLIHAYIYEAVANRQLYGLQEAKDSLREALKIAQEDNIIMTIVEYSHELLEILYSLKKENCLNSAFMEQVIYHSAIYNKNMNNKSRQLGRENEKFSLLTNREKEVLELMAQGKSNKEIGKDLFISEYTVKTILSNIYKKTEVKGRVEAMKLLV